MESSKHWLPIGSNLTVKSEMPQCLAEQYPNQHAVKKVEKLKAAKFQMKMLRIGLFKVEAKYPLDLVAKCYYCEAKTGVGNIN
ncbi:hypothetical protein JHK87_028114 [Glycine soja]|nr:hypothetical protein JHK87_028114 [Glycine soja]